MSRMTAGLTVLAFAATGLAALTLADQPASGWTLLAVGAICLLAGTSCAVDLDRRKL